MPANTSQEVGRHPVFRVMLLAFDDACKYFRSKYNNKRHLYALMEINLWENHRHLLSEYKKSNEEFGDCRVACQGENH